MIAITVHWAITSEFLNDYVTKTCDLLVNALSDIRVKKKCRETF